MVQVQPTPSISNRVALARAAAVAAANYQERFAKEDTEARRIVDIMERFLRIQGRVVYGGAAINAHMPSGYTFYDPSLHLPDYDFLTPDPLQDCADLIVLFQSEGFVDVEAKFGIHEGTYKIFVNFRPAADITYMDPIIYERVSQDASVIGGIKYASVDFLRMNIYLELSRPAGMVSRWEKVYERLLLLNEFYPVKTGPGRCVSSPLIVKSKRTPRYRTGLHNRIIAAGMDVGAVFISGLSHIVGLKPNPNEVVMFMMESKSQSPSPSPCDTLARSLGLKTARYASLGELLPARTELFDSKHNLVAVVFDTVACHNYVTIGSGSGNGNGNGNGKPEYRMGSLDLLIQMYYALYFAELQRYVSGRIICIIQTLIDMEAARRQKAAIAIATSTNDTVFPLKCIGHQPTMPELKRAHRDRVRTKRAELVRALRKPMIESVVEPRRRTRTRKEPKLI